MINPFRWEEHLGTEGRMTDYDVAEAMLTMGGSFMRYLALAFRAADAVNQRRIKDTFAEEWRQYHKLAVLRASRKQADMKAS
jgi:hypothetical protein